MKSIFYLTLLLIILGCSLPDFGFKVLPEEEYVVKVDWLGHAGFVIEGLTTRLYINPYSAPIGSLRGDGILISHSASDLCDLASINTLSKDDSIIISPPQCSARLVTGNLERLNIGGNYSIGEFKIDVVDAYHLNGTIFKGEGAGFIIKRGNIKIYYMGITDFIDEITYEPGIDVLILPIAGGQLSLNLTEAVEVMKLMDADYNVPMYYGGQTETSLDIGREFQQLAKAEGLNVTLLSNQDLLLN